jgi:heme/copper-type cytochrome/quinol oxidase subunit 1
MTTPDRAYHDTYYVVAHGTYFVSAIVVTALMVIIWIIITRLSQRMTPRIAAWILALFVATQIAAMAPLVTFSLTELSTFTPERFQLANRISMIASAITASLFLLSLLLALALVLRRFLRRLRS